MRHIRRASVNAARLLDEEGLTSTFAPSMEAYAPGRNFRLGPRPAGGRREDSMTRSSVAVLSLRVVVAALAIVSPVTAQTTKGILLLAHGGSSAWNTNVTAIAAETNRTLPTEVAFGMADRTAIAQAIDRLKERGVKDIVAVPLFVSSYSSVLTSTEYLLGLRADKPAEVEIFARMRHGSGAAGGHEVQHDTTAAPQAPTLPIDVDVPVKMTSALDAHPIVCDIVVDRARRHEPPA